MCYLSRVLSSNAPESAGWSARFGEVFQDFKLWPYLSPVGSQVFARHQATGCALDLHASLHGNGFFSARHLRHKRGRDPKRPGELNGRM